VNLTFFDAIILFAALLGLLLWFPLRRLRKQRKQRMPPQGP
jgi:hypothetical protein